VSSRLRVLVTKLGLDGHDRGLRLIAHELRDSGVEVIFLGIATRPEEAAKAAVDEDVDAIAVSLLSGSHLAHVGKLLVALKGLDVDIPVVCGGLIPERDAQALLDLGVRAVCPVGVPVARAAAMVVEAAQVGAGPHPSH
jgi:methylmalonyl-CoA mutase C-terminal domain/subunit